MRIDYRRRMGVEKLAVEADDGNGVSIAVIDSGTPWFEDLGHVREASFVKDPDWCRDPHDYYGHATEVSSLLFGCGEIVGVCPKVSPCFCKALDVDGIGSLKAVVKSIRQAVDWKVDIINLSLGFARDEVCPPALASACQDAYNAGITIVCAAGNDGGKVNWPGALPTTICVGSVDQDGLRLPFSSTGEVDFCSPGLNLDVIDLVGDRIQASGTSLSAPLVTGVLALLIAKRRKCGMTTPPAEVKDILRGFATDTMAPGRDDETGFGVIGVPENRDDPVIPWKSWTRRLLEICRWPFHCFTTCSHKPNKKESRS